MIRTIAAIWSALALVGGCLVASAQVLEGPPVLPPPSVRSTPPEKIPLPSEAIDAGEPTQSLESSAEEIPEGAALLLFTSDSHWYEPGYWLGPAPWGIGLEFGLNGSEGVHESLSMRAGATLKRKTRYWKIDSSMNHNRNSANGVQTQNNALLDTRIDRRLDESPWTLFIMNQNLYDEFQAFDLRVSLNTGIGYQLLDSETVDLISRFGAGTSREFGGPDDRWAREALFGFDYEHALSDSQRLTAKFDYFPEWEDFRLYRFVADAGWKIDLDRPSNMSLKFSVTDRYDSTPNGSRPNELNYSALMIWGL